MRAQPKCGKITAGWQAGTAPCVREPGHAGGCLPLVPWCPDPKLRCGAPHVGEREDLAHVRCTLKRKHKGDHVAHEFGDFVATWPREGR